MSRILILGAGFVAGPLVKYLSHRKHQLTVASQFLDQAQAIADVYPDISIRELDVTDDNALGAVVAEHDLTISFVPYQFHVSVAKQCVKYAKHMITASYQSAEMKALHQQALDKEITILNEIGLDPGIDHLSAMKIIDSIHQQGGKVESFISWCGGLPAPDSNNNPLGYKFAWSPISVLMALLNDATYLKSGKLVTTSADKLLQNVQAVEINPELLLEGYPNRDSVSYVDIYGINEAKNVLRGTLRYPGFSEIFDCCKDLGLLDTVLDHDIARSVSWAALFEKRLGSVDSYLAEQSELVRDALNWLGLFDPQQQVPECSSMIDAFCALLIEKLSYAEHERDMVVLQHQFSSSNAEGETELRQSTLILEGDADGDSAMAKTVGTPAAIAADLILSGTIKDRGVVLPMTKSIYAPLLSALEEQGISLKETFKMGKDVEFHRKI